MDMQADRRPHKKPDTTILVEIPALDRLCHTLTNVAELIVLHDQREIDAVTEKIGVLTKRLKRSNKRLESAIEKENT